MMSHAAGSPDMEWCQRAVTQGICIGTSLNNSIGLNELWSWGS